MSGLAEVSRLHNQHSVELDDPSTDYSSVLSGDHSSVVSGGDDSNLSKSSTVSSLCSAQDLDEVQQLCCCTPRLLCCLA